ncbi:unnamed protein product, partial [Mesorhabditis spiculigera]
MISQIVFACCLAVAARASIECYDYTLVGGYNLGSEKITCREGQSCYQMQVMHDNTSILRSGGCVHNTLCTITFAESGCQEAAIGGTNMRFCCCESAEACKWDPKTKGFLHRSLDWVKTKLGLHNGEETEGEQGQQNGLDVDPTRPAIEGQVLVPKDQEPEEIPQQYASAQLELAPTRAAVEKIEDSPDAKKRRYKGVDFDVE